MKTNNIDNLRQRITDRIIEQLETCESSDYSQPWFTLGEIPKNAVTHKQYHGINTLWLGLSGFNTLEFATYKQWESIGAQVQKGSKGYPVIFYKTLKIKDKVTEEDKTIPLMRYSTVFNCSQVDGYEPKIIPLNDNKSIEHVDSFIYNSDINIKHGFDRACFIPSINQVHMPELGQFKDTNNYYSVLFHELTHATGHKSRLDRNMNGCYGGKDYAYEELIAELGSAFNMGSLKLDSTPRDDHAIYIKSWLRILRKDNKFIFSAAAKAQAAVDYLVEMQEKNRRAA